MTTRCRATIVQEYFWYLRASDPEPGSYALQLPLDFTGPLDREALVGAIEAVIARHSVFRTRFAEIEGRLMQIVDPDAPRFTLEVEDRADLPADIDRVSAELVASGLDLASGRTVRGRLVAYGPEHHALVLMVDHAVADAASLFMLQREILRWYARGETASDPPAQFIDYAATLDRLAASQVGDARRAWWRDHLRGATPLRLPVDLPRAAVDERRRTSPLGIISEPMHPVHTVEVAPELRARIAELATAEATSASVVYRAAVLALLREAAGQDDLCLEDVFNPRSEHGVEQVQGAVATWTIMRFAIAGCRSLRDIVARIKGGVAEASSQSLIPEYYETVPAELRGATFNYMPSVWVNRATRLGELAVERRARPFPSYRRHWELMVFVVDSTRSGLVNMTGNQRLWRAETIRGLARRYVEILAA